MANYQLGPESPRPFSVISEVDLRHRLSVPHVPEYERYQFGPTYEQRMCELIHKHLELDPADLLCYVGDAKGSIVPLLQERFCLLTPPTEVSPGHIHYEESPNHHLVPIKVPEVGVESYFRQIAESGKRTEGTFDKILLKDTLRFMDDSAQTMRHVVRALDDYGRLLIIQRPGALNTLPVFAEAKTRMTEQEGSYTNIIRHLQSCGLDVTWELECLPVRMPTRKWYGMVAERFPPQMESVSRSQVLSGLREMSEGVLKYSGDEVEFVDRLLFVTACKNTLSQMPRIKRCDKKGSLSEPRREPIKYQMEVTPEIRPLVKEVQKRLRLGMKCEKT